MKNKILYLLTICLCGSLSMFGQTDKDKDVKPSDKSTDNNIELLNKNRVHSIDLSNSKTVKLDDIASRIKTRELSLDRYSLKIGPVLDIAFGDSAFYILDRFASIIRVPYDNDGSAKQINIRDIYPGDYIYPVSLDFSNDSLFVLDMATASILVFDRNFQPEKKMQLRYSTHDLTVQDEIIVATNLELPSDPSPFIIYDMNGNVVNKQTKDIVYDDIDLNIYCQKPFLNIDGNVYALDWNSNRVYSLLGNNLIPIFEFNFGNRSKPEKEHLDTSKYVVSTEWFNLGDMTILSYLFNDERFYCFYNCSIGKVENGILHQTSDGYAFYPRWQYAGELIGYLQSEDSTGNGSLLFFSFDQYLNQ